MLIYSLFSFLICNFIPPKPGLEEILLPIQINGKTGFVNLQGKVVIKPVFRKVGKFSEGVAPARVDGFYGYINTKGDYVIPPKYDYAQSFSEGLAIVYNFDGHAVCIDHSGKTHFSTSFRHITSFHHGCAIAETEFDHRGLIDMHGQLIVDTVYRFIDDLDEGRIIARKESRNGIVLDTLGNTIFTVENRFEINKFTNGLARYNFWSDSDHTEIDGLVDRNGRKLFQKTTSYSMGNFGMYTEGKAAITINPPKHSSYEGVIDTSGNTVIDNPLYKQICEFQNNTAFVLTTGGKLCQIDEYGNQIRSFPEIILGSYVPKMLFQHGIFIINSWHHQPGDKVFSYVLDSAGNILQHSEDGSTFEAAKNNRYLLSNSHNAGNMRIIDLLTNTSYSLADTSYHSCASDRYCIRAFKSGTMAYFSYDGKLIYAVKSADRFRDFHSNVDMLDEGYFELCSHDNILLGGASSVGFGLTSDLNFQIDTGISLIVRGKELFTTDGALKSVPAIKIVFINNSESEISTELSPYFIMQARDRRGNWRDIETGDMAFCGTGRRTFRIHPKHYALAAGPIYEGGFKTKLRVRYHNIYSNEFDGSVNPAQFWRNWEDDDSSE